MEKGNKRNNNQNDTVLLPDSMICSFSIHNIHQRTNITEGGIINLKLLICVLVS